MTASLSPDTREPLKDTAADPFAGLDSTAQLMTRFTTQLTTQLRSIRPTPPPAPSAAGGPTLVAVAHGSRDPAARRTLDGLLARVRALRPGLRVELGHIELNEPLLPDTLAALPSGGSAVLVPLLFGRGYHIKHDIPQALAAAPHLSAAVAAPLGPHPLLADALYDRLAEACRGTGFPEAVVLAAAGSRDPESLDAAERMAAQLSARLGGKPVRAAYASAASPGIPEAVRSLRAAGHQRVALASYFTAPGFFATRCAQAPGLTAAARPLGAHPSLARLVLHRYDEVAAAGCLPMTGHAAPGLART